jgi:cleavage and polyadenylation specificity factor subunit 3
MSGQKLPLKCSVEYISFSAHTDYKQTSEFIRALKPPHVVLVHGEMTEMNRLKQALIREYEDDPHDLQVYNPRYFVGKRGQL